MKNILCFGDSNTWGYDPATQTRFDNKTQIVKLITKIESILLQTVKTKRVVNQNNKILKKMALQTQYMFDTI